MKRLVVLYLLLVIFFALADPIGGYGAGADWWVYGMAVLMTCAYALPKAQPKKAPKTDPTLARARKVWAAERELGMEPAPIFGYDPPEPLRTITRVPKADEIAAWQETWDRYGLGAR